MRAMAVVALAAIVVGGAAGGALAQRSEAGDRGQRLENDALRTDVRRDRLLKSAAPRRPKTGTKAKPRSTNTGT